MFYSCSNVTFYDATFYCSLFLLSFQFTLDFLLAEIILFVDCSIPVVVCGSYIIPLLYTRIPFMSNVRNITIRSFLQEIMRFSWYSLIFDMAWDLENQTSVIHNVWLQLLVFLHQENKNVLDDWRFGILKILFHNYT